MFITLAVTASLLIFPGTDTTTLGTSQAKTITQEVKLSAPKKPSLKVVSLTADEIYRAGTQASVSVPADAEFLFSKAEVTAMAPPPPPPPPAPEPEPETVTPRTVEEVRAAPTASRTRAPSAPASSTTPSTTASSAPTAPSTSTDSTSPSTTTASGPASTEGGSDLRNQIVEASYKYIGTPYGTGAGQLDCSAFTQAVFAEFGISLPRTSSAQSGVGRVVSASEALPGDLVWWPGHIGIYLGDGQHIAARNPSKPLQISKLYRDNPTYIRVVE